LLFPRQKDVLPLYSYFPETTTRLMDRYLQLRAMKSPDGDTLVVSLDGRPLGADGCRRAVKEHCEKLGIRTHEGRTVTPHRLRHSFGTLNIEPLGLGLSLIETEALRRVRALGLNHRSLWKYAEDSGAVARAGRRHMYSEALVDDLAGSYFTREEALDLLGMPISSFWEWVKVEGIRFAQVGNVSLFPKDTIMAKRRAK
jgi:integrase